MKQFTGIGKLDTGYLYALELASSASMLLLAFGLMASMANNLPRDCTRAESVDRMPQRAQPHGTAQRWRNVLIFCSHPFANISISCISAFDRLCENSTVEHLDNRIVFAGSAINPSRG